MAFKAVSICALVLLLQQCIAGPYYRSPSCGCESGKVFISEIEEIEQISYKPLSIKAPVSSCVSIDVANNGGPLVVTSIGGIAPSGIAVATELGLGGDLILSGELPYLSAVAFEGQFASAGAVPVSYSCGDSVAITEQIGGSAPLASSSSLGYSIPSSSLGYSIPSAATYSIPSISSCGCKY